MDAQKIPLCYVFYFYYKAKMKRLLIPPDISDIKRELKKYRNRQINKFRSFSLPGIFMKIVDYSILHLVFITLFLVMPCFFLFATSTYIMPIVYNVGVGFYLLFPMIFIYLLFIGAVLLIIDARMNITARRKGIDFTFSEFRKRFEWLKRYKDMAKNTKRS